jgi:hypothetical protein
MFRTRETYQFDLVDDNQVSITCQIEITSRRDYPDVDPHNASAIGVTTDARLSMITRCVIIEQIAKTLNGMPIDGPILDLRHTNHAPERIAVWAYWLAHDQSELERETTVGNLVVESARISIANQWIVEYAPTAGDR